MRRHEAVSRMQLAHRKERWQFSALCLLLSAFCFLPSAFRFLLSAFRLLPSAFRLLLSAFFLCGATIAFAQSDELALSVHKSLGFNNGSQIQGTFRMEVTGPANLTSVTFKVDETIVGTVTAPPFRISFRTEDYPVGWHTLTATGQTADGRTLASAVRRFEFLTSEQAWANTQKIIIPVFVALGLAFLIGVGAQFIGVFRGGNKSSRPLGAPRSYGVWGGAICPQCGRPFPLHWWGLNAGFQKFDRCDGCGKWSLVGRASRERLAEAEAAELKLAQPETPVAEKSPQEKLKDQLDASRFLDDR